MEELQATQETAAAAPAKKAKIKLPGKRTINLAAITEKKFNWKVFIPAVILIIIAAALFSKFAVADRLAAVSAAEARVAGIRRQIDEGYAAIRSYGDISTEYAHYSLAGLTDEELGRLNREEILDIIETEIRPYLTVNSVSVSKNQLTMSVTGNDLQEITDVVARLKTNPRLTYATVGSAQTTDTRYGSDKVTASVVCYVADAREVQE
ncbi:MAG: hypothetical protein II794_00795 [Oscillospiraceae bacterium]|nr:hypothetical protein [Oscillospiraceae bacterium]